MDTKLVKNIFLEICALLGYYAAYSSICFTDVSGQPIGTIFEGQEIQGDFFFFLVRKSLMKFSSWIFCPSKMGPIGCPETSVTQKSADLIQFEAQA